MGSKGENEYMKTEDGREQEMKAILCGQYVKCRGGGKKKGRETKASFINSFNKPSLSIICSLPGPELGVRNVKTDRTVSVFKIVYCAGSSNGKQQGNS